VRAQTIRLVDIAPKCRTHCWWQVKSIVPNAFVCIIGSEHVVHNRGAAVGTDERTSAAAVLYGNDCRVFRKREVGGVHTHGEAEKREDGKLHGAVDEGTSCYPIFNVR
jgi:hypothetical protein